MRRLFLFGGDADLNCIIRALSYFSGNANSAVLLLAFMSLSMLTGLLQVWPLAVLIDTLVSASPPQGWVHRLFLAWLPETPVARIAGIAAIALGLRLAQEGFGAGRKVLHFRINYNSILRVRSDLFRKLQALHLGYHRSHPAGDTVLRLTTDTAGCHMILAVLINVVFAIFTISVILAILISRSGVLTLLAFLVVPPLVWANVYFGQKFKQKTTEVKEADCAYASLIHHAVAAIRLTQLFGREQDEFQRFKSIARNSVRSTEDLHKQEACYRLTVGAILGTGAALILGYGGYLVHQQSLTPGELMLFMTYLGLMLEPLCQLTGAGMNLQSGLVGAKRIFELLDNDKMVAEAPGALPMPVKPRTLTLENVRFHYEEAAPVLDGITVAVTPGTSVGFVGSSGGGKSTLLNLLPRFYDPTSGRIALDGHDIRKVQLKDLRSHIALALQDSVMLPTNIRENIAYGRPTATPEEIREAARLAGASDFIDQLPQGYDTELSESAQNLSGGQRQRIAIARALLTEAPILVLDEPTSSQDTRHEGTLVDTLRSLKGKRTLVLVSHRISTVRDCNLICVLDKGRIREMGSHEQLLQKKGLYYSLARNSERLLPEAA